MDTFSNIIGELEGFAAVAWAKAKEDAIAIEQAVVPVIETDLVNALKQFGQFAVQKVVSLMGAEGANLSGSEKLNLLATSLKDQAVSEGVELKDHIVSAVSEAAYTTVMGQAAAAVAQSAADAQK